MSNGLKLLMIAASAIIVCIVCVVGFNLTKEGKNSVNASTHEYVSLTSNYSDVDLAAYDGMTLSGAEVVTMIKENAAKISAKEFGGIRVNTKGMSGAINCVYEGNGKTQAEIVSIVDDNQKLEKKNDSAYINPAGKFLGSVKRNSNGMIESITFDQQ